MMSTYARSLSLLLALLLVGCGQLRPMGERHYYTYHTVAKDETLYSIAFRYGYDYKTVARWNHIKAPYQIAIGQRLVIIPPRGSKRPQNEQLALNDLSEQSITGVEPSQQPASMGQNLEKPKVHPKYIPIRWQWPATGTIAREFSPKEGIKGIDIRGQAGQSIFAAASGKVVYSGNGLIGYGNLVIIKHNNNYLSAYGHNRKLLVKEGDAVQAGQKIAEMGQATGKTHAMVHFEIRKEGKPVNPKTYLPTKQ